MSQTLNQSDLNREMVASAKLVAQKVRASTVSKEKELNSAPVRRLLGGCIDRYSKALDAWIAKAKASPGVNHSAVALVERIPTDYVATLAARTILNSVSTQKPMTTLCVKIGEAIEDEIRFREFTKVKKARARSSIDRLNRTKKGYEFRRKCGRMTMKEAGFVYPLWSEKQRLHVGSVCLDIFINQTGLVKIHRRWDAPNRATNIIVATDECMKWIHDYMESEEVLYPRFMPMVEKPKPWSKGELKGCGYNVATFRTALVKARNKKHQELIEKADMPKVLECANNLQGTGWRVNEWMFDIMYDFWQRGLDDGNEMPINKALELPTRPPKDAPEDKWKAYNKRAAYVHTTNIRYKASRVAIAQTLSMAKKFKNEKTFYFPVQLDFRGRCYYLPAHLNPQGTDYARALLEFSEGKEIKTPEGMRAFMLYGVSLFGNDKIPHDARLKWVAEHHEEIKCSAMFPYNSKWWTEAKEPWMFLRWCAEYHGVMHNRDHVSRLPITVDCTASGLQILSLLTGDEDSAKVVNLTESESPSDIYTKVCELITGRLLVDASYGNPLAKLWLGAVPDRELCKTPVMTIPYGGTFHGMRSKAEEWLRQKLLKTNPLADYKELYTASSYFSKMTREIVNDLLPSINKGMSWLVEVSKPVGKANKNIVWTSPSGFPVAQPYYQRKGVMVKTAIAGKFRYFKLEQQDLSKVDARRQSVSVAPNFIHSLDASIVHLAFGSFDKPCLAIHDCYGALADDLPELTKDLRSAMVKVFSRDNLEEFKTSISKLNSSSSPATSFERGAFDVGQILKATYIFG